jgi:hypothetical protein
LQGSYEEQVERCCSGMRWQIPSPAFFAPFCCCRLFPVSPCDRLSATVSAFSAYKMAQQ